uniref:Peptidase C1A papain C-terminal domain-containing protein n=1 Tax=Panagrolaimus sp. JU765 TaxID=591449 RepID=A0AC34RG31_9BILA
MSTFGKIKLIILFCQVLKFVNGIPDNVDVINETLFDDRVEIFKKNLEFIAELRNSGKDEGIFGINSLTTLSRQEFEQMLMKNKPEKPGKNASFKATGRHVPPHFDMRNQGWMTSIKMQGTCSSCWAFATTALLETQYLRYFNRYLDLSEQELVNCAGGSCQTGGWIHRALSYVQRRGLSTEINCPYADHDQPCVPIYGEKAYLSEILYLDSEEDIAEAVYYQGPVAFGMHAPESLQFYKGGIYHPHSCHSRYYHEMIIVGYAPEYWIVKNSWSEGWGDRGYLYLKRGRNVCGMANHLLQISVD